MPDTKTTVNQTDVNSNVRPRSGCANRRIIVGSKIKVLITYLRYKFFLSDDKSNDITITKKGFKVSIG